MKVDDEGSSRSVSLVSSTHPSAPRYRAFLFGQFHPPRLASQEFRETAAALRRPQVRVPLVPDREQIPDLVLGALVGAVHVLRLAHRPRLRPLLHHCEAKRRQKLQVEALSSSRQILRRKHLFPIVCHADLSKDPRALESTEREETVKVGKGSVRVCLRLPKRGFVPGEPIGAEVTIENKFVVSLPTFLSVRTKASSTRC